MTGQSSKDSSSPNEQEIKTSRFEEVFLDCYASLKSVVSRYLKRPEDVEDIVQEVFVRTYEAKQKSRILNLRAYFFTTARNLSLKHKALHANKMTDQLEVLGVSEVYDYRTSLETRYEANEQFSIFCEAVRELPPQCRRVLILKKGYGLSHSEIAERLNITVSTTNQHLAKGIAKCTLYMRERGYLVDTESLNEKKQSDGKS